MKCPKCDYLGFETGDRCRNCGYDFSLMAAADSGPVHDLPLHPAAEARGRLSPPWESAEIESALPLFPPVSAADERSQPLVPLAPEPRPPVPVRRTPEIPRLQGAPRVVRTRTALEPPRLELSDGAAGLSSRPSAAPSAAAPAAVGTDGCDPRQRATAVAVDLAILSAISLVVVYLTLRMAAVAPADWRLLPLLPLTAFLGLLAFGYFSVFTAVGGQTIGKMAAGIRVVSDDGGLLQPARAVQRTAAAVSAFVTLGGAFAPALRQGGRALHDRMAGTRVVGVRPS